MFQFDKNKIIGSSGQKVVGSSPGEKITSSARFGNTTNVINYDFTTPLLESFLPKDSGEALNNVFREIYLMDHVAGPTVDIISTLPWSDFNLTGINDEKVQKIFEASVAELGIVNTLIQSSVSYLVLGILVGSLIFNESKGIFTDLIIHNPDKCEITEIPLRGYDPKIDLKVEDSFKKFLRSKDPRDKEALKELPQEFLTKFMKSSKVQLEPLNTIYLSRSYVPGIQRISYYYRILPIWLIEKALMRGTILGAWRRQRGILHVTCLTGDTLVSVDGNLTRLDSICDKKGMKKGDYKKVDFITKGKDGQLVPVDKWIYQGKQKVKEITTESGYQLKATDTHKVLVLNNSAELIWKETKDLKLGDHLCIDKNLSGTVNTSKLELDIKDKIWKKTPKIFKTPKTMTPELAYILGMLISDGTVRKYSIVISNTNIELINKLVKYIKLVFDYDASIRIEKKNNSIVMGKKCKVKEIYHCTINSIFIINILNQIGVISNSDLNKNNLQIKLSNKKTIPFSILQSDYESKLAFLAGYIDGDGVVLKNSNGEYSDVCIGSYSTELCKQLQILLIDLGIKSSRGEHRVTLNRYDGRKLYRRLRKYLVSKHKKVKAYSKTDDKSTGVPLSCFSSLIDERFVSQQCERRQYMFRNDKDKVIKLHKWGKLTTGLQHRKKLNYISFKDGMYDAYLDNINRISKEIKDKLYKLLNSGYIFEQITSIRKSKKEIHVYDLSIKKGYEPAFVANGIVVHNCGTEDWMPTDEQLDAIGSLFQNADQDPQGAVVVTRPGLETNEIRQGSDFWKVSEEMDTFANAKMKALGISEAFLSGDANFSNQEVALSIFMENLKAFRQFMTKNILYDKIFLLISKYHGIRKRTEAEIKHNVRLSASSEKSKGHLDGTYKRLVSSGTLIYGAKNLAEAANYTIPSVHWHKDLNARSDTQLVDMYKSAEEKGIPIPLAMFASATGVSMDEVLMSLEKDIEMRKEIKEYNERLQKEGLKPASAEGEEGGGEDGGMYGSVEKSKKEIKIIAKKVSDEIEKNLSKSVNLRSLILKAKESKRPSGRGNLPYLVK